MNKLFLSLLLIVSLSAFEWDYQHEFLLGKDEFATVEVIKREDQSKRVLQFRWTLYQNDRLVVLVNYDGFPTQYVLQKKYKRNSIKIPLRDDYLIGSHRSYMILNFSAFNDAKKSALLKTFIVDPKKRIEIKFIDSNTSKG